LTPWLWLETRLVGARDWLSAGDVWRLRTAGFGFGTLGAVGFAPLNSPLILLFALMILVWLIDASPNATEAFRIGWLFGLGNMLAGLYWIAIAFQFQSNMPAILGAVAVFLLSAFLAFYGALACGFARRFWTNAPSRIFWLAAFWGIGEWLRGHLFTGFPWNLVSTVWVDVEPVAYAASWIGSYGLSVFTVLVAGAVAVLADRTPVARSLAVAVLIGFALMYLAGRVSVSIAPINADAPSEQPKLLIVQADIDQLEKYDVAAHRRLLVEYLALTRHANMAPL
jgi:apolipoprotein N-acyltransferase